MEDHLGDFDISICHPSLELGAGEADLVGTFQGAHILGPARPARRA